MRDCGGGSLGPLDSVNMRSVQLVMISYSKIELSSDVLSHLTILSNQG